MILVAFSVVYLLFSACLSYYFAAVGFILSNCVNMVLRIAHG